MSEYRIYCFQGGENLWSDGIVAANDDDAVNTMRTLRDVVKAEVWQGSRLVASLDRGSQAQR